MNKKKERVAEEWSKFRRMEQNMETSTHPDSIKHWKSLLDAQQENIVDLEEEPFLIGGKEWSEEGNRGFETEATKGEWLLTDTKDWCGKWKKR